MTGPVRSAISTHFELRRKLLLFKVGLSCTKLMKI